MTDQSPAEKTPTGPGVGETGFYANPGEAVGTVVAGKYKLLEALGQGGMGDVFMAQQIAPVKRLVALKLIKLGMDSRQVLSRFEAERQALALMDHPNIAKVLDAGANESGRPFFVMELVKGVPITRFCDARQLSTRERLELFIPVCQAIQHAHQKGIIHRDIKPTNVLVALYDDRPVPKVIDFGVAKAAGSQLTDASLVTGFGAIVGTPEYMSPEQAQLNQLDIDTRSDVYALGVLLYELLTGTTPIDRKRLGQDALLEVLRLVREVEPPRPSARLSTCDTLACIAATRKIEPAKLTKLLRGELDWIVMKCLEKERSRRYETANALARDLERYLHDEVVEARPPSARYRLRKFMRKHRAPLAMAATVVVLLVAGIVVSMWQAVRATRAESDTAKALIVAEENQQEAERQRAKAETQAASLAMDIDLKYCEDGQSALGLLRLAQSLPTMPEHARELRQCAVLNILAWGQRLRPATEPLDHDGYAVNYALLSPDGRTVLTYGRDGTARLWDSVTGRQRAILGQPAPGTKGTEAGAGWIQFSKDGSLALTLHCRRKAVAVVGRSDELFYDGDGIVRVWDVAGGRLRAATGKHDGSIVGVWLSPDGSLLVTANTPSLPAPMEPTFQLPPDASYTVFFWNAQNGQLIRKLDLHGTRPLIDISPDSKSVLIAQNGQVGVWAPQEGGPLHRLPGDDAAFSPRGKTAVTYTKEAVHWWNTVNWQLERKQLLPLQVQTGLQVSLRLLSEDVLHIGSFFTFFSTDSSAAVTVRGLSEPIVTQSTPGEMGVPSAVVVTPDGRFLVIGTEVYDTQSGQRLPLPRGRRHHSELGQLSEDGRFTPLRDSFLVDLAADKKIILGQATDGHFLKDHESWVGLGSDRAIRVLRKADAELDAKLLQKWCQVIVRGTLDENGRFRAFDEAAWEKARRELAQRLEQNPQAQSLRRAVADRLYWLRQEIAGNPQDIPLRDRLVAAEPTWAHYTERAAIHAQLEHWDLAIRDELEAARLAGPRYWHGGSILSPKWKAAVKIVQVPNRPPEEYERALRWVEARTQAGIADQPPINEDILGGEDPEFRPRRSIIAGLALLRLGRYAEALAMLQTNDVPLISEVAGMLMSRWNALTVMRSVNWDGPVARFNTFDAVDLLLRAMCHHHLGHTKEATDLLRQARGILGTNEAALIAEHRALLREARSLIEVKAQPGLRKGDLGICAPLCLTRLTQQVGMERVAIRLAPTEA